MDSFATANINEGMVRDFSAVKTKTVKESETHLHYYHICVFV